MIDWIKKITREYPDFWKNYLKKFNQKSNKFVVFTLETTGLNKTKDVILSIGAIVIENNQISVGKTFEVAIPQFNFFKENGLLERPTSNELPKMIEANAIEAFITFIENSILVGHRIHFDIEIINVALEKMGCGTIKNEALDIEIMHKKLTEIEDKNFAIDQLAAIYNIPNIDGASVSKDAFTLSILFIKLKQKLGIK